MTHTATREAQRRGVAALKERRGHNSNLRPYRANTQNRELAVQVIPYNVDGVSRKAIKEGRLTKDRLEAMDKAKPEYIHAHMCGRFTENAFVTTTAG